MADRVGLRPDNARLLRLHGSGVYLLPHEDVVVRLVETTRENRNRWSTAVRVTAWLVARGFPTVEPVGDTVVETRWVVASLWRRLPQPAVSTPAPPAVLGAILRQLHHLPDPPFKLPQAQPLARLRQAMAVDATRERSVLPPAEREFLAERLTRADDAFRALNHPLGDGLIHNDAHCGNLLVDPRQRYGHVLADWDGACRGPRAIDLIQLGAPGNRFGVPESERQAFCNAYGYDVATWSGWPVLRELRELHSLAAYIRVASDKPTAREELRLRLGTLRTGDRTQRWTAIA